MMFLSDDKQADIIDPHKTTARYWMIFFINIIYKSK